MSTKLLQRDAVTGHGGSPSLDVPDYWWYRARAELLRTVFEPRVAAGARVLDVGSADGPSVGWLDAGGNTISMDVDPRGLRPGGVCGSALALPFRDDAFDVVTAFDVIEHCDPEHLVMSELTRVLKPGGTLMLAVPAYQWAWSDHDVANGHHRRYTRRRLTAAARDAGMEVERVTHAFAAVFPMFAAERLARRVRDAVRRRPSRVSAADVVEVPQLAGWADRLLGRMCRLDERLLSRVDLPFGSSVLICARKPEELRGIS